MLLLDQPVSNFTLSSTSDKVFSLSEKSGKNLVVYFYPKDDTPG
ncbi:MAG: redoxin domain-containing protein, partial [Pseudomonadota bacterium]